MSFNEQDRVPAMPQPQLRLPASRVLRPWAGAFRVPTYD
jgi:hypothetical protein